MEKDTYGLEARELCAIHGAKLEWHVNKFTGYNKNTRATSTASFAEGIEMAVIQDTVET